MGKPRGRPASRPRIPRTASAMQTGTSVLMVANTGQVSLFEAAFSLSDLPERVRSHVTIDPVSGCWRCSLSVNGDGYSHVGSRGTHRIVYELLVGPIPSGLVLDHVKALGCRWRDCCWPLHLQPVTNRVNILRGFSFAAINAAKTHCDNDHEFTEANTYWWNGRRDCRICIRARVAKYKTRLMAAGLWGIPASERQAALWGATGRGAAFRPSCAVTSAARSRHWPRRQACPWQPLKRLAGGW